MECSRYTVTAVRSSPSVEKFFLKTQHTLLNGYCDVLAGRGVWVRGTLSGGSGVGSLGGGALRQGVLGDRDI